LVASVLCSRLRPVDYLPIEGEPTKGFTRTQCDHISEDENTTHTLPLESGAVRSSDSVNGRMPHCWTRCIHTKRTEARNRFTTRYAWTNNGPSAEPIILPKIRIRFVDFPWLLSLVGQRLCALETSCGLGYGHGSHTRDFIYWAVHNQRLFLRESPTESSKPLGLAAQSSFPSSIASQIESAWLMTEHGPVKGSRDLPKTSSMTRHRGCLSSPSPVAQ
jgi:hypothetical protein